MGACASRAKEPQDEAQLVKYAPETNGVKRSTVATEVDRSLRQDNAQPTAANPPGSVQVEFDTDEDLRRSRSSAGGTWPQGASNEAEVNNGLALASARAGASRALP